MKRVLLLLPALIFAASAASAADAPRGNTQFESFSQVKKILLNQVFNDHRTTIYCGASFTPDKQVILPKGFMRPNPRNAQTELNGNIFCRRKTSEGPSRNGGKARRNA